MATHLGVLHREALHLVPGEAAAQPRVQLAREVVVEFREQLDVEEEHGRGGELGRDDVEEDFRAGVLGRWGRGGAGWGFEGGETQGEEGGAVAEEDGFAACFFGSRFCFSNVLL